MMLSQELVKTLLESSLPLRLALLDADPNGYGVMFGGPAGRFGAAFPQPPGWLRPMLHDEGRAWLPCNPLATARHAVTEYGSGRLVITHDDDIGWRFDIMDVRQGEDLPVCSAEDKCPHTAAVALLREVVAA